jgi:CHASE3 domain sensor protein
MPIKATRTLILSQPAVSTALAIAFILICGSALLSALSTRGLTAGSQRIAHTQQTLIATNQLLATIVEAETGQRGFLLTRDSKYLTPYEAARARLPVEIAQLRRQFADLRPDQTTTLDRLQTLVNAKFEEMARTLTALREQGIAPALDLVGTDEGWSLMNEIQQVVQGLQARELGELTTQSTAASHRAEDFHQLNTGLITLAVLLAGVGAWLLLNRVHELEQLITVCAWTRRVQWQGRWLTFEEYFTKRFNLHFTHGISDEAAQKVKAEARAQLAPAQPRAAADHSSSTASTSGT